jgi:hypothetical protein
MEEILKRGWEDLVGRSGGLMSFRVIIQPAVAICLAISAGLKDARQGRPPFLWNILSNPSQRHELLHHGWKDVGTVFIVALVLDSIYQVIVHAGIYALELLVTATILALVPYLISRGFATRVARWAGHGNELIRPSATDTRNQVAEKEPGAHAGDSAGSANLKADNMTR